MDLINLGVALFHEMSSQKKKKKDSMKTYKFLRLNY